MLLDTAKKADEVSLDQGEIVHVVDSALVDRWYVRKEDGTEGCEFRLQFCSSYLLYTHLVVPYKCFRYINHFKYRVRALCSCL